MKRFLSRHNWKGLKGLLLASSDPLPVISRYYRKSGTYPYTIKLRTPVGPIGLVLHSHDDLITVHEIFFRLDYNAVLPADGRSTAVDFGANIGIASAFFASRAKGVQVFAYEPVPRNIERAKVNLAQFGERVRLTECAVGVEDGTVSFGVEATGRYGGIGLAHATQIEVPCRRGADELTGILEEAGTIDVLKLDIEEMELPILRSLTEAVLAKVKEVFAECDGHAIRLPGFRLEQVLSVARFYR